MAAEGEAEIVILNSRFIASGKEVRNTEQAEAFLKLIQARYPDASHHCYAFKVLGPPQVDRFSDDGEPNGTAGRPILTVLEHHLHNAIIVVTRYFGGTKLGKGGLVKAYTEAAKNLIDVLGTLQQEAQTPLRLEYPYSLASSLDYWYRQQGFSPSLNYGASICSELEVPLSKLETLQAQLRDWEQQGLSWQAN